MRIQIRSQLSFKKTVIPPTLESFYTTYLLLGFNQDPCPKIPPKIKAKPTWIELSGILIYLK